MAGSFGIHTAFSSHASKLLGREDYSLRSPFQFLLFRESLEQLDQIAATDAAAAANGGVVTVAAAAADDGAALVAAAEKRLMVAKEDCVDLLWSKGATENLALTKLGRGGGRCA